MRITNPNTLIQALANMRLESLTLPENVEVLLNKALTDSSVTTEQILELLRNLHK